MSNNVHPAAKAELYAAVAEVCRDGWDALPGWRTDIVDRFLDKGVSRATAFNWVRLAYNAIAQDAPVAAAAEMSAPTATPAPPSPNSPTPVDRVGPAKPDSTQRPGIAAPPDLGVGPRSGGSLRSNGERIQYAQMLRNCFRVLDAIERLTVGPDGKIRNAQMHMKCIEARRRLLTTAKRIQPFLKDIEACDAFLQSLVEVIFQEEPAVRNRISSKMRATGCDLGLFGA
jgi:hypothetical protein